MFESKEAIKKHTDKLMALADDLSRGEVLKWSDIEDATGLAHKTEAFKYVQNRFRQRLLRERHIATRAVPTVGVELLTEQLQVRWCSEYYQRKAFRSTGRAVKALSVVEPANLAMHDRRLRLAQLDRLKGERRQLRAAIKEVKAVRKSEVNPMRKVSA